MRASLSCWRAVRFSGFFQSANRAPLSSFASRCWPWRRASFQTSRQTLSSASVAALTMRHVELASHARRLAKRGSEIERPPPPAAVPLVIARAAPTAVRTAIALPSPRSDRHHQRPVALVDLDLLDHRSNQPQQHLPYPEWAHVATTPFTGFQTSGNPRSAATCAPLSPGRGGPRPDLAATKRSRPAGSSAANPLQTSVTP